MKTTQVDWDTEITAKFNARKRALIGEVVHVEDDEYCNVTLTYADGRKVAIIYDEIDILPKP